MCAIRLCFINHQLFHLMCLICSSFNAIIYYLNITCNNAPLSAPPNIHISLIRQMLSLCLCMYVCARTTVIQFNRSVLFSNQAKREGNTQWMRSADNGDYNECYRQNNKTITNFPETASKIISLILTCSDRASLETSYSCKVQPESSSRLRLREQSPAKALQSVLVRRTFGTSHMPSFNCP